jgi:polar amino acid transport system permease protein
MHYQWDFKAVLDNLPLLMDGLRTTIVLTVLIFLLGIVLGLLIAMIRYAQMPVLAQISTAYVEFFRTTPLYTQLVWLFYCVPIIVGATLPSFESAVIAFSLNFAAFQSEIFRAGILSLSRGQREAALALGMTQLQALRRILVPQAINRVIPPTASMWVALFKDTSIVSMIAVADLMYRARQLVTDTYRPLEVLTVAAIIYFLVTYPQARLVDYLHHRLRVVE